MDDDYVLKETDMMIIAKKALPRRTVLRGMGATLALPFLDAMVPALGARSAISRPKHRLGFLYCPSGMPLSHFIPRGDETIEEMSPILRPLAAFSDQMVVVTGLSNASADVKTLGQGSHTRCGSVWLNGVCPKRTEGADIEAGTTIDQYCAREIGSDTPLMSLELALENNFSVGNCDSGYSCTYVNTFSWKTPTTPNPMEHNPRAVFERLFGEGGTPAERVRQLQTDRSILDWVSDDIGRLRQSVGPEDRLKMAEYLEAIRDVERRIQKAQQQRVSSVPPVVGVPDGYDEHARVMLDLQFLAYQADITRVVTFQMNREQSAQNYPWIGVQDGHHDCSHHAGDPERVARFVKINTYHCSLFAHLVEKMAKTPDGDGTLLDQSTLLFGSGMGDGSIHSSHELPLVLVGGGCGQLKGGRILRYPTDTPMPNLLLAIADKVGVELEGLGDSTGTLPNL